MAATKKLRYSVSEEQHTADWETGAGVDYDDAPQTDYEMGGDPDYDDVADPDYDEAPQADYELGADPDYDDEVVDAEVGEVTAAAESAPAVVPPAPAARFAYELGRAVLPATQQQAHPVLWRGQLKERHPATGLVQRINVYRLGDGFWDCYREDELRAA